MILEDMVPDESIQGMILDAAAEGMAVAELEYLGLSLRVVNTLEEKVGIVYIEQLIDLTTEELIGIKQLGRGAVDQIAAALNIFPQLEAIRHRWNKGSERTEYYKRRVNTRKVLA